MSIDYNKYIYSTGTHYISNSGGDEKGGITGGAAGDQTGKEWQLRSWYNRPWSCVLRHPDPKVRRLIAELAIEAALNNKIGYDQNQRGTFWKQLKVSGYRPANITAKCEADCSAGANSIVKAVGYLLGIAALQNVSSANSSRNTKSGLKKAGFEVLSASKYLTSGKYLLPGDILLYVNHHVATNITRGKLAEGEVADSVDGNPPETPDSSPKLGERILKSGMSGADVKELQRGLIALGYSCGPDGADGEYGGNTAKAVKAFQQAHNLEATGAADLETITALVRALDLDPDATAPGIAGQPASGPCVVIENCKECNVRTGPGAEYAGLGLARAGQIYSAPQTEGWVPIIYNGSVRWVSAKYARRVDA